MAECGLDVVLALIGGKWKMLILYHVWHGTGGSANFDGFCRGSAKRC